MKPSVKEFMSRHVAMTRFRDGLPTFRSLRNFMLALLSTKEPARYTDLVPLHYCRAALIAVLDCPECVYAALGSHLDSAVLIALVKRCSGSASTEAKESMLVATVDMDTRKVRLMVLSVSPTAFRLTRYHPMVAMLGLSSPFSIACTRSERTLPP